MLLLSFIKRYWSKLVVLLFWLSLLGLYEWYTMTNGLSSLEFVRQLLTLMKNSVLGPLIFIVFYALQPLIFFPSWLLTVSAGFIYGPVWGTLYTLLASNISSMVAYLVGRYFQQGILDSIRPDSTLHHYMKNMRDNSFETVLVMRFLFLPYDIVSYLSGFLRINWKPFLLATILGSIPGTLAFVLFGASIEGDFDGQKLSLNPWVLGFSISLFAVSLILWRYLKRHTT